MTVKPKSIKTRAAVVLGLLSLAGIGQAGEKIDPASLTALAGEAGGLGGNRAPVMAINGEVASPTEPSIYLVAGGNPDEPADWRQDGTANGNSSFGQNTAACLRNRTTNNITDSWLMIDLGQDYPLETMNVFNMAVSSGGNHSRGVQQADIYHADEATGPGSNANENKMPFDPTGWTLLGTAGTQTFTRADPANFAGGNTALEPDQVDFGGATARYVAIDFNTNYGGSSNIVCIGEVQFFRAESGDDPVLKVDLASADPDFGFGNVFGNATRSVTYVNNSLSGTATINIDDVSLSDDAGGAFGSLEITYDAGNTGTTPLLESGDKVTISVTANNSLPGGHTGSITIDTTSGGAGLNVDPDFNDAMPALTIGATFADGEKLNAVPLLEDSLWGWPRNGGAVHVTPGIAPASQGMARVPGEGDADGSKSASLYQTNVPNGFPDFEFITYFTPASTANFVGYVDPDGSLGVTGPDGDFTDRTFQWVLLGSDANPPAPAFGDTQAGNTIINIAYLPDGASNGGTPDFYTFDGIDWNPLGIGAIAGSVDNDADGDPLNGVGDGLLDTSIDSSDVINVYKLKITGTGFGTGAATYDVAVTKVSGPDSFVSGSASDLTDFHGLDGDANAPTGHAFITSDLSADSNIGDGSDPGFRTPFWVDDTCLVNGTLPDPSLTLLSEPSRILVDPPATTGTTSFSIRNDGDAASLEVTSIDTGTSGFTITSANSFTLAPNAVQQINLQWDSTASAATPLYETATLTINSSNHAPVEVDLEAGLLVNHTQVLNNWDFETPGTDNVTDTDTFADWSEEGTPTSITDVAGLIAPSATAAAFAPASAGTATMKGTLTSPPLVNFTLEFDFAVSGVARDLYFFLQSAGSNARANIAYLSTTNSFIAYDQITPGFIDVLPIALTPGTPYKLKVTGSNWGVADQSIMLEVMDASGTSLATSAPFAYFQNTPPIDGLARLDFTTTFGGSGGVTVDEVSLDGQSLDTTPPATDLLLANPVFVPGAPNTVTADISGGTVDIFRSATGEPGSWGAAIATGLAPGTGVVIDPDASLTPTALYIAVEAGGSAP